MLWGILRANFARIEARYYELDLMEVDVRKLLNLTYGWLIDLIGGTDAWERDYAPIFEPQSQENDTVEITGDMGLQFG